MNPSSLTTEYINGWIHHQYNSSASSLIEALIDTTASDLSCIMQDQSGWLIVFSESLKISWNYKVSLLTPTQDRIIKPMILNLSNCTNSIYEIRELKTTQAIDTLDELILKYFESKL